MEGGDISAKSELQVSEREGLTRNKYMYVRDEYGMYWSVYDTYMYFMYYLSKVTWYLIQQKS